MLDALINMFGHPQADRLDFDGDLCRAMADGLRDIRGEFAATLALNAVLGAEGDNVVALPLRREYLAADDLVTPRPPRRETFAPIGEEGTP